MSIAHPVLAFQQQWHGLHGNRLLKWFPYDIIYALHVERFIYLFIFWSSTEKRWFLPGSLLLAAHLFLFLLNIKSHPRLLPSAWRFSISPFSFANPPVSFSVSSIITYTSQTEQRGPKTFSLETSTYRGFNSLNQATTGMVVTRKAFSPCERAVLIFKFLFHAICCLGKSYFFFILRVCRWIS